MGQQGLKTDDAATNLPPTVLIDVRNVSIYNNLVEKERGSAKYNATPLTDGILGLYDWYPTSNVQRLIAVTADGKIWRDTGDGTFSSSTPITTGLGSPTNDSTKLVAGGQETAGNNRKLFIFTGTAQVQVLSGDATSTTSIALPAADWSSIYPTFGVLHRNRLFAFGNSNDPHRVYASDDDNHEKFDTGDILTYSVFPGEGDGIRSAIVYKGRLFVFKNPTGVYYLEDADTDPANWYFKKLTNSFGVAGAHSLVQVMDDLLAGNSSGTVTSLQAVQAFGDLKQGDIMSNAQVENFYRSNTSPGGYQFMNALYYEEKKQAYFTYRNQAIDNQNRLVIVDIARQTPRFLFGDKDQISTLALRKDSLGINRPIYGNEAGFVFSMDQETKNVGGDGYNGSFQTPHMDMSFVNPQLANKNKLFDFLTLVYEPTGSWSVDVEVYVDGIRKQTLNYKMMKGNGLDEFILDVDTLGGTEPEDLRKPLSGCYGRRISFLVKNINADEDFRIEQLIVGFRVSDERQNALTEGSN